MLEVTLEGTPYEMGYQHGAADPERVKDNVEVKFRVREKFAGKPGFDQGIVEGEKRLQAWDPALIEEMRGIADGAGLSYRDVLIHNLYSFLGFFTTACEAREGCSCAGFARTPYGPLVGKTNDNTNCGIETHLLARCYPPGKVPYIQVSYIGMVGCFAGMNQQGFTIGGASVSAGDCGDLTDCLFISWLVRRWLEACSGAAEAIEQARSTRIFSGCSFLMADLKGRDDSFVHVEYFEPNHVFVRYPVDNRLFFTNHPVTEEGGKLAWEVAPEAAANSRARFEILDRLTRQVSQTPEGVKEMMSSHSSPVRICQHKGVEGALMDTDSSLVFVPQEGTLYISRGHPCEAGFDMVQIPVFR